MKFGTDGVRGEAFTELTVEFSRRLGAAAGRVLGSDGTSGDEGSVARHAVVGADPRESSPAFVAGVSAGFRAAGIDVTDLGLVPTPVVAFEAGRRGAIGAMVSASHNVWSDNGIKLFAPGGRKLSDSVQHHIEAELDRDGAVGGSGDVEPVAAELLDPPSDVIDAYSDHVLSALDGRALDGLRVVVDCANGAATTTAADIFRRTGADVHVVADRPNGRNINDGCGATFPRHVADAVVERSADVGIALDGDADRLIAVDATGEIVDGDHVIAICALDLARRGELVDDTVVVTVMTNLGFRLAMSAAGIEVVETPVGDRYVLEALAEGGYTLGGEQSGHVVFPRHATTGDGVLTALVLLDVMARSRRSLADLAGDAMTSLPQTLVNVRLAERVTDVDEAMGDLVADAEERLGQRGRILVRPSGTEPLLRIMVEAPTDDEALGVARRLADAATARLG